MAGRLGPNPQERPTLQKVITRGVRYENSIVRVFDRADNLSIGVYSRTANGSLVKSIK